MAILLPSSFTPPCINLQREMAEELKLYRTWSSPYALRAVQALKIKGLEYEPVFEDLSKKSSSLLEYNPVQQKVPVLLKIVDAEKFPLLSEWMNSFSDDPVIKECWPPRDKMVEKFKAMREPYLKQASEKCAY